MPVHLKLPRSLACVHHRRVSSRFTGNAPEYSAWKYPKRTHDASNKAREDFRTYRARARSGTLAGLKDSAGEVRHGV